LYLSINRFLPSLRALFFVAAGMARLSPWKVLGFRAALGDRLERAPLFSRQHRRTAMGPAGAHLPHLRRDRLDAGGAARRGVDRSLGAASAH
jgi:hypothetical protein